MSYIIGVKKLAELLGVNRRTIYRYIDLGMPYKSISEYKKAFDLEEVKEWIGERK